MADSYAIIDAMGLTPDHVSWIRQTFSEPWHQCCVTRLGGSSITARKEIVSLSDEVILRHLTEKHRVKFWSPKRTSVCALILSGPMQEKREILLAWREVMGAPVILSRKNSWRWICCYFLTTPEDRFQLGAAMEYCFDKISPYPLGDTIACYPGKDVELIQTY